MSNVLIDRNAVMDYLREQQANVIIEKNKNGFVNADVCDGMSSAIGAFMNFILQIPTAYDVDKVVDQINDLVKPTAQYRHNFCGTVTDEHCVKYDGCESCMAEQICKVVKSGGIE